MSDGQSGDDDDADDDDDKGSITITKNKIL
jgi:hypothetical protein